MVVVKSSLIGNGNSAEGSLMITHNWTSPTSSSTVTSVMVNPTTIAVRIDIKN